MATLLETIHKELEEVIARQSEHIAHGGAETLEEYKYVTGRINGLSIALERLKELQKYDEEN
jgi:hypothetical protein